MTILQLEAMLDLYRRNRNITLMFGVVALACSVFFGVMRAWGGVGAMVMLSFWVGYWLVHTQRQIVAARRAIAERVARRDLRIHRQGLFMRDVQ